MVRNFVSSLVAVVALSAGAPACASKVVQNGGETNWVCVADVDCNGTASCVAHQCVERDGATASSANGGAPGGDAAGGARSTGSQTDSGIGGLPMVFFDGALPSSPPPCSDIDLAAIQANPGPTVSFKNDIMPIFGLSCTASDCHKDPDRKAGLYLGVRCKYDPATKVCSFPAVPDTSGTSTNPPAPLTDQVLADVYASLLEPAKTVTTGDVMRVAPGSLSRSFLIDSLMGTTNDRGYTCTNQDPSHEANPQPCGDSMPLNNPPECSAAGSTPPRLSFLLIARWIAEGAPNN
jgi:hypothetical protein